MNPAYPLITLPAVLVGGPPHSGKSVLIYSLSQALRARGVEHYALRACPDGEGDWSNETPPERVRQIRIKGPWTSKWVERITRDIDRRHLPLLVDVGGKPTPDQAALFGHCTHAVLLTPSAAAQAEWQRLVASQGVPVIADLASTLEGDDRLETQSPCLRGVLAGLDRNSQAKGPAFDALVDTLAQLFTVDQADLRRRHLASAPAEIGIDLDSLARTLHVPFHGEQPVWQPCNLPALVDYLPAETPLAVYGRGAVWVYAALARLAHPARFASFDVRLGWVDALRLPSGDPAPAANVRIQVDRSPESFRLLVTLPEQYVDYDDLDALLVPPAPAGAGVILDGKLPIWLMSSLAVSYAAAPWLAVHQPALGGDVVVYSSDARVPLGHVLPAPSE